MTNKKEEVFVATVSFVYPQIGRFEINGTSEDHVREQLEEHAKKCQDFSILNITKMSDIQIPDFEFDMPTDVDPKKMN